MSSIQDSDIGRIQRKSRRAQRVAIVFLFLLATFWSLDSIFIWLFLGAISYSLFLAWFFKMQIVNQETNQEHRGTPPNPIANKIKSNARILISTMLGLILLIFIFKMIFSSSASDPGQELDPGNTDQSTTKADNSKNSKQQQIDVLTDQGNAFYNQGNYDSALYYYEKVLKLDEGNQYALYDKALVYYSRKDYDGTLPILLDCIRRHPDYGEPYWLLGDVYYDRNDLGNAKMSFELAYEKGVRNGAFLQTMASLYESGNKSRSIQLYQESLAQDSTLIDSYKKLILLDPDRAADYRLKIEKLKQQ